MGALREFGPIRCWRDQEGPQLYHCFMFYLLAWIGYAIEVKVRDVMESVKEEE